MIEIKSVTKKYGDKVIIDKIDLTVDTSSVLGLAGFNGCGKTTLLNICAGVFKAESGGVYFDSEDAFDNNTVREKMFYVSDTMWFPVGATIQVAAKYYACYHSEFDFTVLKSVCDLFSLDTKKPIKSFSKGMTRQAGIALALAAKPKYLLIDESFDGLDPHKKEVVRKLLLEYVNETEASVIISSHDLAEIGGLCDRIAIINGSKVVLDSSIDDISNNLRFVSVVFNDDVSKEAFNGINCKNLKLSGRSASLVVHGDVENEIEKIKALSIKSIETRLLSLEEVFAEETEVQNDNEKIKKIFK